MSEQGSSSSGSFMRELRRRKVLRTCFLYVLICWGVLQVGDIVYPALGWDDEVASRTFLYLAVLGFPVTFAIAWFFQITPDGIVLTTSFVERRILNNIAPVNDRRRGVGNYFRKEESEGAHQWVITAETGPLAGLSFAVQQPITLGRALECDLAVVSPHISRQHAKLEVIEGKLMVVDLGSSNGTIVNGKKLEAPYALHNEDELRFHDIVFRVTEANSAPQQEMDAMNKTTFIRAVDIPEMDEKK